MGLLKTIARCALCLLATAYIASSEAAAEFDTDIDMRGVASNGERSYLDGGLGELRFDSNHQGLQVGDVNFAVRDDFFNIVHVDVNAVSYADNKVDPLDLTEAYVEVRPFPSTPWRSSFKLGAFYAPISLENRLIGWRSAYSISPSAINTWVGEELRTVGAEYDLDWLGHQSGHDWQLGAVGSLYGWNDPAGVLMAERGWAIDDRQTTLFGPIGRPGAGGVAGITPFATDVDHRPGYYVGANATYRTTLELRALHYDNEADPTAHTQRPVYAWHTRFDSAGVSWTPSPNWTVISQWLGGDTFVGSAPDAWAFLRSVSAGQLAAGRRSVYRPV